jgi:hypothetical protein
MDRHEAATIIANGSHHFEQPQDVSGAYLNEKGLWCYDIDCGKCSGKGHINGFEHILSGVCFRCNGTGRAPSRLFTDAQLIAKAKRQQREEAKQAAKWAAGAAARYDEAWEEAHVELEEFNARAARTFIGAVGEKISTTVTIDARIKIDSYYGTKLLIKMSDEAGNLLTTFTDAKWAWNSEAGDKLDITGTVKNHEIYRGDKQTVLTRCKPMKQAA